MLAGAILITLMAWETDHSYRGAIEMRPGGDGSHGRSALLSLVLGSVVVKVLATHVVPILVLR
jgi:hypothetical protein